MFFASLVFSGIILLIANLSVLFLKRTALITGVLGFGLIGYGFGASIFNAVLLQTLILVVWLGITGGSRYCLARSLGLTFVAYLPFTFVALQDQLRYSRLLESYAYVSLDERLPPPKHDARAAKMVHDSTQLDQLEQQIDQFDHGRDFTSRSRALERLHENTREGFLNSSGFGSVRMIGTVTETRLKLGTRPETVIHQPGYPERLTSSIKSTEPAKNINRDLFESFHFKGLFDFIHPDGFGYVKDRQHVAGFQEHAFSEVPAAPGKWKVVFVELIGLMRAEPVVYVSDNLPAMNELRKAPTRPPDAFEQAGLKSLQDGEDLYIGDSKMPLRMIGSIRATKQCLSCHEVKRGDLLGAFSYTLQLPH